MRYKEINQLPNQITRDQVIEIRKEKYETEEEAQQVCHIVNERHLAVLCPLVKDNCDHDCVCFQKAMPTHDIDFDSENMRTTWRVWGFYCDNAMFKSNS